MKVIIAGGRNIHEYKYVEWAVKDSLFDITEVVCGGASGVDTYADKWAYLNQVPCHVMPALWDKEGRAAGPLRNRRMAEYADALILVWDGKSAGSASMKREAERRKLKIHEVVVNVKP